MLKNILKIAFRNIWKNKVFSLINIIGLSIGLSASFVIGAIIYYDLTFDKFHPDGERIYRITTVFTSPEGEFYNRGVSVPLAEVLRKKITGVENVSRIFTISASKVENPSTDKTFEAPQNVIYTEGSYFKLFDYQWLGGDPNGILSRPNEVVLSEKRAKKYFPDRLPDEIIGETLVYNDTVPHTVSGVVANFEHRSDLVFEEFISIKSLGDNGLKNAMGSINWYSTNSTSNLFVKLNEKADVEAVQKQLDGVAEAHQDKEMLAFGQQRKFHLQPLDDIHFNPDFDTYDYTRARASKSILTGLAFVALFLLLLGCVNFINLNTAQATKRAKEIGIRKTLGSSKKQLVFQFLGETFILTLAASLVSLFLSSWLLRVFADFIPVGIGLGLFKSGVLIASVIVLLLLLTLLSGIYPALVLSRFKPVSVLKNQILSGNDNSSIRKYLTVFQFVIAQIFIIATLFVGRQLNYLMTKDMGFETEAIVYLRTPYKTPSMDKRIRLVNEIEANPHVQKVTLGGNPPASRSTYSSAVLYRDGEKEVRVSLQLLYGSGAYRKLYGIPLLAGRDIRNDTIKEYVINKTFMEMLGFKKPLEALGKYVTLDEKSYPIVGVMDDFYQRSLHTAIQPMALIGDWHQKSYSQFNTVHFLVGGEHPGDFSSTVATVEKTWNAIYPESSFNPVFVDETIKQFYEQERRTSVLMKWATGLAILISCLGLLGLVIYTTERRTKEIGIRKVLGATLTQLNFLLCKEFLALVAIAFAIATPIAWWGTGRWLQGFAHKTDLSWWIFGISGTAMVLIALVVIGIRTMTAAKANPVDSLRRE